MSTTGDGRDAVIVDAVRTPIGRHRGALATVRPDDLAATVIRALVERTNLDRVIHRRRDLRVHQSGW